MTLGRNAARMGTGMRVIILCREFPPDVPWGGIGTYTYNLAAGLAAAGLDVTVLGERRTSGHEVQNVKGFRVVRPARPPAFHIWPVRSLVVDMLLRGATAWRFVNSMRRHGGLDVVEFPDWLAEGYLLTRRWQRGIPTLGRIHGYMRLMARIHGIPHDTMKAQQTMEAASLRAATLVAANTRWIASLALEDLGLHDEPEVLYMSVDTELFAPNQAARDRVRATLGLSNRDTMILSCGRVERRKGFRELVGALAQLGPASRSCHLVVAGRGESEAEGALLRTLAGSLGVSDRVHLIGPVQYHDMPAYYSACDIYAGASRCESPGMTYLEAMSCGCPLVAYADGAIPEIVVDGMTGFLVQPGQQSALADALARLASDSGRANEIGKAGAEHVRRHFSWDAIIPLHIEAYNRCVQS